MNNGQNAPSMPKDPMVNFRKIITGQNSRGGSRTQLYLDPQEAMKLAQFIYNLANQGKHVKLDLNTSIKTNSQSGHQFESAYVFIKEKQQAMGAPNQQFQQQFNPQQPMGVPQENNQTHFNAQQAPHPQPQFTPQQEKPLEQRIQEMQPPNNNQPTITTNDIPF